MSQLAPSRQRRSYHTDFKFAVFHGLVPESTLKKLPKATRHGLRHTDPSHHFGAEYNAVLEHLDLVKELAQSKADLATALAVVRFCHLVRSVGVPFGQFTKVHVPELRKKVVDTLNRLKDKLPLGWMLQQLGLTAGRFKIWSQNAFVCLSSPFSLCRRRHPQQLTPQEVGAIRTAFLNPDWFHWPAVSVAWKLIADHFVSAHCGTILKYARVLGLTNGRRAKRKPRKAGSIRAHAPNEVWHVDVTMVATQDQQKKAVQFVVDNFSRRVLSHTISDHPRWENTVKVLTEAHRNIMPRLDPTVVISDAGSENCNHEVDELAARLSLKHLVAQRDVRFSNSVIEAWNKIFKGRYIFVKPILSVVQLEQCVQKSVEDYNNRPHYLLKGLTPNEAYRGEVFDKAAYETRLRAAQIERQRFNKRACAPCVPQSMEGTTVR